MPVSASSPTLIGRAHTAPGAVSGRGHMGAGLRAARHPAAAGLRGARGAVRGGQLEASANTFAIVVPHDPAPGHHAAGTRRAGWPGSVPEVLDVLRGRTSPDPRPAQQHVQHCLRSCGTPYFLHPLAHRFPTHATADHRTRTVGAARSNSRMMTRLSMKAAGSRPTTVGQPAARISVCRWSYPNREP